LQGAGGGHGLGGVSCGGDDVDIGFPSEDGGESIAGEGGRLGDECPDQGSFLTVSLNSARVLIAIGDTLFTKSTEVGWFSEMRRSVPPRA
jgi:hypothetical protein